VMGHLLLAALLMVILMHFPSAWNENCLALEHIKGMKYNAPW